MTAQNLQSSFNVPARGYSRAERELIDAITVQRPDLAAETFYVAANGNSAVTLLAGDEVFKASSADCWSDEIETEIRVLSLLAGKGMAVPEMTTIGAPFQMVGMKKVDGVTLSTVFNSLAAKDRRQLAADIVSFKCGLEQHVRHESTIDDRLVGCGRVLGRSFLDGAERLINFTDVKQVLAQNGLHDELTSYIARAKQRQPVAVHCDLHEKNILVSPDNTKLAAVIDFGSVHFSVTPEQEFYSLDHGPRFASRPARKHYDPAFNRMLQDEYASRSDIVTPKDRLCFELLWEMREWSENSAAPWVRPRGSGHRHVMGKIGKTAEKIKKLQR